MANAVRLTINPKSVTDVEGVRDVALALKAAKKIMSDEQKAASKSAKDGQKGEDDTELKPLVPNAPR